MTKEMKNEFAPGCFDNFEGTQEELDELIADIKKMFASGESLENAVPLDLDDMSDEEIEWTDAVINAIDGTRRLQ
jgi:hypothetical protein